MECVVSQQIARLEVSIFKKLIFTVENIIDLSHFLPFAPFRLAPTEVPILIVGWETV